jgi:dTDP-glucose 4,6-dehydratase
LLLDRPTEMNAEVCVSQTILITGAAGFIGSNFTRYWRVTFPNDNIVALDALTYAGCRDSLADLLPSIAFIYGDIYGDIRNQSLIEAILRDHRVDVVVNFAAESHNSLAVVRPGEFFTPYNASKAGADHAVRAYFHTYGLPVTITICSNNYGPYQFPEKVIPLFITRALRREPLPLYASTTNRREWLHVADHCRAIAAVLSKGPIGETYNVGSGEEADVETIADSVKSIVPDRPSHDRRYLLDSSKIRHELSWAPSVSFARGLRQTIEWYCENEAWWGPLLDRRPIQEDSWTARP